MSNTLLLASIQMSNGLHKSIHAYIKLEIAVRRLSSCLSFRFCTGKRKLFEKQRQQFCRAENSLPNRPIMEPLICWKVPYKKGNILSRLLCATRYIIEKLFIYDDFKENHVSYLFFPFYLPSLASGLHFTFGPFTKIV